MGIIWLEWSVVFIGWFELCIILDLLDVFCGIVNEVESDFVDMRIEEDIELLLYVRELFDNNGVLDVGRGCNELEMLVEIENDK